MPKIRWLLFNFWGPFFGAGIRLRRVSSDFREIEVSMKLYFWNQNYLGTHYGGSLYSMADPFYVLMLIQNLGPGYTVWDKAAKIRFLRPGRGRVSATFHLSEEKLAEIRDLADDGKTVEPMFMAEVVNEEGLVIAEVEKTLYVRRKNGSA